MAASNKTWTRDDVENYIKTNDRGLIKGLMLIYELQTETEKQIQHTVKTNGVGFSKPDSKKLTSMAIQWQDHKWLSEKQISFIRFRLMKYCGQLTRIANKEIIVGI